MVTVVASAGGELKELRIDPKAIDPNDPEMLADLVLAAVERGAARSTREGRGEDEEPAPARPRRPAAGL